MSIKHKNFADKQSKQAKKNDQTSNAQPRTEQMWYSFNQVPAESVPFPGHCFHLITSWAAWSSCHAGKKVGGFTWRAEDYSRPGRGNGTASQRLRCWHTGLDWKAAKGLKTSSIRGNVPPRRSRMGRTVMQLNASTNCGNAFSTLAGGAQWTKRKVEGWLDPKPRMLHTLSYWATVMLPNVLC